MKLSIITVVYNARDTISRTIESVLKYKDDNIEYIIIDGKSNDGTLDIINKYLEYIDVLVSEQDNGIYDAMNKGLSLATGDIVGFINADDWYEGDILHNIIGTFDDGIDIVYGNRNTIEKDGTVSVQIPSDLLRIKQGMVFCHQCVFVRKECYLKYGGFDVSYKICADYNFFLKAYLNGARFKYHNKIVANYSLDGISSRNVKQRLVENWMISCGYANYYSYSERNKVIREELSSLFNYFIIHEPNLLISELQKETNKNIAIWGTGVWGQRLFNVLTENGIEIKYWVDSDIDKIGKTNNGLLIIDPEMINDDDVDIVIAIKNIDSKLEAIQDDISEKNIYCKSVLDITNVIVNDYILQYYKERE